MERCLNIPVYQGASTVSLFFFYIFIGRGEESKERFIGSRRGAPILQSIKKLLSLHLLRILMIMCIIYSTKNVMPDSSISSTDLLLHRTLRLLVSKVICSFLASPVGKTYYLHLLFFVRISHLLLHFHHMYRPQISRRQSVFQLHHQEFFMFESSGLSSHQYRGKR